MIAMRTSESGCGSETRPSPGPHGQLVELLKMLLIVAPGDEDDVVEAELTQAMQALAGVVPGAFEVARIVGAVGARRVALQMRDHVGDDGASAAQVEPAHEPISTGGPPSAAGQTGSSEARSTRSPVQSRRMIESDSSKRRKRAAKSRPRASKSAAVDPAPTPSRSRPPDTRWVVSTRWASSTGFRSGTWRTPVPSSMWRVTVAATERAVSGSARRNPRPMASNAQALSKPAASIRRAASARLWATSAGPLRPPEGRLIPKRVKILEAPWARYAKAEGKTSPVAIV